MICKFCEAMRSHEQADTVTRQLQDDRDIKLFGRFTAEYTVAIVRRCWYAKQHKRRQARTVEFRYRGLGFALNYCPECGRKFGGDSDD